MNGEAKRATDGTKEGGPKEGGGALDYLFNGTQFLPLGNFVAIHKLETWNCNNTSGRRVRIGF